MSLCVLNYLVILLKYTDFYVFSFGNLVLYSIFVFGGKFVTVISTFATPISNLWAFSLKIDSIGCLISIRSELNYSQIDNFIFWWTFKQLVSNSPLYLIFIATHNKYLFTIILKIHIFAIFCRSADVFYTFALFWYQNSVVFLFFLLIQYSIEISLHIFTFYLFSFLSASFHNSD